MPLDTLHILAIVFHFAGFALLALSFVKIAVIIHDFSTKLLKECTCFPGTNVPMYPKLIVFGSTGFLFATFAFAYAAIPETYDYSPETRFFAISMSLLGNMLILSALRGFTIDIRKNNFNGGVA